MSKYSVSIESDASAGLEDLVRQDATHALGLTTLSSKEELQVLICASSQTISFLLFPRPMIKTKFVKRLGWI